MGNEGPSSLYLFFFSASIRLTALAAVTIGMCW
jgi:hypothetical protein